jgi:O-antigen/teichoic acid export membrane protein
MNNVAPPQHRRAVFSNAGAHSLARLARNSLANLLRLGASWVIVLAVPPLLVRLLDPSSYATWMLVLQLGAYATLFDGGLQLAVGRFVARARPGDWQHLGEVLSSAAVLMLVGGAFMAAFTFGAAFHLGRFFHSIPQAILPQARDALLLVGGSLSVAFPFSVLAGLYLGLEQNHVNAVAGSLSRIAGAAGTVWAAFHHQGLVLMAAWTAAGTLAQPAIFVLASRHFSLRSILGTRLVKFQATTEFAKFCSAMVLSQLSMLLITGLDLPIVAAYDFPNASYYALAAILGNVLAVPQGAILSTMVPTLSSMSAVQSSDHLGRVLVRSSRVATAMLAAVAVPLMAGMPVLLHLWVGANYAQHSLLLGEVLVAAQVVRLTLMPYALIGFSAGEQNRMLVSPVAESIVNLACSLVLVRWIGALGVAVGTLIGAFLGVAVHFWNSMPRTRSITFSRSKLLCDAILQPIGMALLPAAILAVVLPHVPSVGVKMVLLSLSFATLIAVYWKWQLQPEDRLAIRNASGRLFSTDLRRERVEA